MESNHNFGIVSQQIVSVSKSELQELRNDRRRLNYIAELEKPLDSERVYFCKSRDGTVHEMTSFRDAITSAMNHDGIKIPFGKIVCRD